MFRDAIRRWLTNHPRVLTALFVGLLYLSDGIDLVPQGGAEGYAGP